MTELKNRMSRVLAAVAFAVAAVVLPAVPAAAQEAPSVSTYTDAVDLQGLILEGGTVLASLIAAVMVLVFAMLVVKSAVRWFRGV